MTSSPTPINADPVDDQLEDRPLASEVYESLNGYEELAIVKMFGFPVSDYAPDEDTGDKGNMMAMARALAFVCEKRKGLADQAAFKAAMTMTTRQVTDYFGTEVEEFDETDPVTPEGKGD